MSVNFKARRVTLKFVIPMSRTKGEWGTPDERVVF